MLPLYSAEIHVKIIKKNIEKGRGGKRKSSRERE
jgi:hypothetical protein